MVQQKDLTLQNESKDHSRKGKGDEVAKYSVHPAALVSAHRVNCQQQCPSGEGCFEPVVLVVRQPMRISLSGLKYVRKIQ